MRRRMTKSDTKPGLCKLEAEVGGGVKAEVDVWKSSQEDIADFCRAPIIIKEEPDRVKFEPGCQLKLLYPEREVFIKAEPGMNLGGTAGFVVNMSSLNMCSVPSSLPSSIQMQGVKLEMQQNSSISDCDLEMRWEPIKVEAAHKNIVDYEYPYFLREPCYINSIEKQGESTFQYALCSKEDGQHDNKQQGLKFQTTVIKIEQANRGQTAIGKNIPPADNEQSLSNNQSPKKMKKEVRAVPETNGSLKPEKTLVAKQLRPPAKSSDANKSSLKCKHCSMKFETMTMLKKHKLTHEKKNKLWTCMLCSKTFTYNCNLIRHWKLHTGFTKQWDCTQCASVFRRKYHLDRHRKTHETKRDLTCKLCSKRFSSQSGLSSHLRKHSGEYSRRLRSCTRFKTLVGLDSKRWTRLDPSSQKDLKVDTEKRNEVVSCCDKSENGQKLNSGNNADKLSQKSNSNKQLRGLFKRKRLKVSKPKSVCPETPNGHANNQLSTSRVNRKKFRKHIKPLTFNQSVYRNLRRRCGKRPITCAQCLKKYKSRADLVRHLRSHTGARPFKCPECYKTFTLKSSLTRHFRIHTGEKPYACLICSKAFSDKSALMKHFWKHSQKRPFVCKVCGNAFTQRCKLTKHLNLHNSKKRRRV